MPALPEEMPYTIADIEALPENTRAELMDGALYDMAAPSVIHQLLCALLTTTLVNHIKGKKGTCKVFPAPFAVFINGTDDIYNYLEPDISVVCDPEKLKNGKGCDGAPDWIIEITSPSTAPNDYMLKLRKYQSAGVREYWIVNPASEEISVYIFSTPSTYAVYTFHESVPSHTLPGLSVDIHELLQ